MLFKGMNARTPTHLVKKTIVYIETDKTPTPAILSNMQLFVIYSVKN